MTPTAYRAALAALGLSQLAAGRLLGIDARTSRRYALGETAIPEPAARFLRYLIATKTNPADVLRALNEGESK